MLTKEQFRESLDKFYTKGMLYGLYKEYFINWIAEGYIGKNLDIFEVSMIGRDTDKKIFLDLLEEIYLNKETFQIIFKTLDEEIQKIFLEIFYEEKSQTENARNTIYREGLSYKNLESMKRKYLFFRHDAGFTIKGEFFYLDYDIVRVIKKYILDADAFSLKDATSSMEKEKLYRNNNELEFLNNMKLYLEFFNSGEIHMSESGKILKNSKMNMLKHCNITEYYSGVKTLDFLKTETICLFLYMMNTKKREIEYFNPKNIKNIINDLGEFDFYTDEYEYPFTLLFLNYLKGVKNIWEVGENTSGSIKSLLNLLKEIKEDEHISVENIINAFINRDIETELVNFKNAKEYMYINEANFDRTRITTHKAFREYITEPFVKTFLFLLGALGVFEIFYKKPEMCQSLYLKNEYLTKYDGIKYVKLTNLGKYVFGYIDDFDFSEKFEKSDIQLDDKRLLVTIIGENPTKRIFFEKVSQKIGNNLYKITKDSFIKKIKDYSALKERIEKFKETVAGKEIPKIWLEFFEDLIKKYNSIQKIENFIVFKLENKDIIEIISKEKKFKSLVLKAEDYHIIVKEENKKELEKLLKEYGYYFN